MGSVRILTTIGDNDPELEAVDYYRHYFYCDHCGSFKIEPWMEPKKHLQLMKTQIIAGSISAIGLISTTLSLAFLVISLILGYISTGLLTYDQPLSFTWFGLSLFVVVATAAIDAFLKKKIKFRGVHCGDCSQEYESNSSFLTDYETNPRNHTQKDIPPAVPIGFPVSTWGKPAGEPVVINRR